VTSFARELRHWEHIYNHIRPHQALGYLGSLAGFTFIHDACQDPFLRAFLAGYMAEEATPTLAPVPGIDLAQYRADLLGRFSNPHVRDTLARLCVDSSERMPKFLLPVVRDAGFTVFMPSLFGVDGAYPTAEDGQAVIRRACVSAEFSAFAGGGTWSLDRLVRKRE